jgi:hypothetical protein
MSKILILTNPSDDETTDRVILAVQELGGVVIRWHVEDLLLDQVEASLNGFTWKNDTTGRHFTSDEISAVWMRRPRSPRLKVAADIGSDVFAKEESMTLLRYALRTLEARWYSHPDSILAAENKLLQLKVAERCGLLVPEYLMTSSLPAIRSFIERNDGQVVIKPASSRSVSLGVDRYHRSLGSGVLRISDLDSLGDDISLAYPVFLQRRIDREVEVRSTVIGSTVTSVAIHTNIPFDDPKVDGRWGQVYAPHSLIATPENLTKGVLEFQRYYGLNYGAFDFLPDKEGNWWFLECNPVGQFAWKDERIQGLGIVNLFAEHLVGNRPVLVNHKSI